MMQCRLAHITTVMLMAVLTFMARGAHYTAGETVLTLNDAIDIALEESYNMKSLRLQVIQAEQTRNAAKYRFRTHIDLNLDVPDWSERVQSVEVPNALPVYNSYGTLRYEGQLDIRQPLPTDGDITLRTQMYQSDESTYLADQDKDIDRKDFYTSIRLQFNQPLFTYNQLKTGLKSAELRYDRSSKRFNRMELDLMYDVTQSFFNLYSAIRRHEINQETMEQKKNAYEIAKLKFEAGLIPEVEALQTEVDYASAQADLLSSEAAMERQRDQFKQEIGLSLISDVTVKTDIEVSHFDIDLDKAIKEGMTRRSEITEQMIEIELQKISVIETDARSEITGNLSAFYDFTGISDSALPYNTSSYDLFDSSWDDLNRRPRNRGVGLSLSVPIWDWGVNKAEVASAKATLKNEELYLAEVTKQVESSIREVVRSLKEAESRLNVLQKSQDVAQRSYDISLERFDNGEITSQDLALDSQRLTSAKLAYLSAYITYKLAVADLRRKTLWDFENNESLN